MADKFSSKEAKDYIKNVFCKKAEWITMLTKGEPRVVFSPKVSQNILTGKKYITQSPDGLYLKADKNISPVEFGFSPEEIINLEKQIKQFTILHEYGHIFEFLKKEIISEPFKMEDTIELQRKVSEGHPNAKEEFYNQEGNASKFALENMYRKDARSLLPKSQRHYLLERM